MRRTALALALLALAGVGGPLPSPVLPMARAAEPAPVDAGLATQVQGQVTVTGASGAALPLEPFMKVRVGDAVEVPEGGTVQLVFFASGMRETWTGPVSLEVDEDKARGKGQPVREEVGGMVGHSLESLPGIIRRAEIDLAGQRKIRGDASGALALDDAERAQLEAARADYAALSAKAPPGDILAHVSYASLLIEYGQYDDARAVLADAATRCGDCALPGRLLSWLEARTAAPE